MCFYLHSLGPVRSRLCCRAPSIMTAAATTTTAATAAGIPTAAATTTGGTRGRQKGEVFTTQLVILN